MLIPPRKGSVILPGKKNAKPQIIKSRTKINPSLVSNYIMVHEQTETKTIQEAINYYYNNRLSNAIITLPPNTYSVRINIYQNFKNVIFFGCGENTIIQNISNFPIFFFNFQNFKYNINDEDFLYNICFQNITFKTTNNFSNYIIYFLGNQNIIMPITNIKFSNCIFISPTNTSNFCIKFKNFKINEFQIQNCSFYNSNRLISFENCFIEYGSIKQVNQFINTSQNEDTSISFNLIGDNNIFQIENCKFLRLNAKNIIEIKKENNYTVLKDIKISNNIFKSLQGESIISIEGKNNDTNDEIKITNNSFTEVSDNIQKLKITNYNGKIEYSHSI